MDSNSDSATHRTSGLRGMAAYHSSSLAWAILVVSLILTAIAWFLSNRYIHDRAADRFQFRTAEMSATIERRMLEYEQVLRGGVGLFEASEQVSRQEWKTYFTNAAFQEYYPGIQGVGFSRILKPEEKAALVQSIREEGFPDFDIHPKDVRDVYSAIVYLEPFDWRNQRAFGFDMYSESTRRTAMDSAIATGLPTISGVVTLVQETDEDVQRGFLVYLPVFARDEPAETPEQRAAAITGFVFAPFRAKDLMSGIGKSDLTDIEFEVFDGKKIRQEDLLYDSNNQLSAETNSSDADFILTKPLNLRGRVWTLQFESQPDFISRGESAISLAVACGGLLVDVLLFLIIGSIGRQQRTATTVAEQMTNEFRKAQKQFQAVCDTAHDPIILVDPSENVVYANPATTAVFGFDSNDLIGMPVETLFQRSSVSDDRLSSTSTHDEFQCVRNNGDTFPALRSISRWHDDAEEFDTSEYAAIVVRDITEQKRSETVIRQQIAELRRSNRDLDDFAYVASHDLRSPLRNIDHLANWVIEDAGDQLPTECKEHLGMLKNRIGRMDQLLTDLLQYSRAGRVHDRVARVDLQDIIANIVGMLKKPADMQIHIDIEPFEIHTLKTPLETCLRNLISNAIKHHDREDGNVSISAFKDDQFVRIVVEDDGPGIAPKFQQKIFKIFQTLAANSDGTYSSGIGLSIIKKTAETYGGRIEVKSEIGKGARFTLHWPTTIVLPINSNDAPAEAVSRS